MYSEHAALGLVVRPRGGVRPVVCGLRGEMGRPALALGYAGRLPKHERQSRRYEKRCTQVSDSALDRPCLERTIHGEAHDQDYRAVEARATSAGELDAMNI